MGFHTPIIQRPSPVPIMFCLFPAKISMPGSQFAPTQYVFLISQLFLAFITTHFLVQSNNFVDLLAVCIYGVFLMINLITAFKY